MRIQRFLLFFPLIIIALIPTGRQIFIEDKYSKEFHEKLNQRLKKEGFFGSYILLKNGKILLQNSKSLTEKIQTPGLRHFLVSIKILVLYEKKLIDINEPISNYIKKNHILSSNYSKLPIYSFLNQTSGVGTKWEPGGYWQESSFNAYLLEELLEKILKKNKESKSIEKLLRKIPNYKNSSIQKWLDFELEFSIGNILQKSTIQKICKPTELKDSYTTNRIQYGLGLYTNGNYCWGSSSTLQDSFLYYKIIDENITILMHSNKQYSKGELISWKSILTEFIYEKDLIHFEPWINTPKYYQSIATLSLEEELTRKKIPAVGIALVENYQITNLIEINKNSSSTNTQLKTLYKAGSLTKPIAALACHLFLQDYKISDTISLNDFAVKSKIDLTYWKKNHPTSSLTPFYLLSHSSGITERPQWDYETNMKVKKLKDINNGKGPGLYVYYLPGTKSRYSGGGYSLIQEWVQDTTKISFSTYTKKKIFKPLKMNSSFWTKPLDYSVLEGHDSNGNIVLEKKYIQPEWAAGGLYTRPEDLAKFFIQIQKCYNFPNQCIFPSNAIQKMLTPVIPASNLSVHSWIGNGFFINTSSYKPYFYHGGHTQGHKSTAIFHTQKGYGIVIMTNSEAGNGIIWSILRSITLMKNWDKFIY